MSSKYRASRSGIADFVGSGIAACGSSGSKSQVPNTSIPDTSILDTSIPIIYY